jgi:O-antigen ligase
MLAILAGGAVVLALRPATRLWRPVTATIVLALVFWASGIRVPVRGGRNLSATDIAANAISIGGASVEGDREATRTWRLEWWHTIVDYTVHGPYFWTGKGYGVNLAQDDGFVVGDTERRPLRSPHNGHLTILARSGVPGAVLWLMLQGAFAIAMVRAYRRAANTARDWWARVDLWILACWVTFVVNAAFEVSLEGPQGGIWFWSLFGFGIAALRVQRARAMRHAAPLRPVGSATPWRTRVGRAHVVS